MDVGVNNHGGINWPELACQVKRLGGGGGLKLGRELTPYAPNPAQKMWLKRVLQNCYLKGTRGIQQTNLGIQGLTENKKKETS